MTPGRVAAGIGGAAVLAGWLASAAGLRPSPPQESTAAPHTVTTDDSLAGDIQRQAERLRIQIDSAPAPRNPTRNPFEFARGEAREAAPRRPVSLPAPDAPPDPGPTLFLVAIAEHQTPDGTIRTAVISGLGDLFLVKVGDSITMRYRVIAIGADAAELADEATGGRFRLALR